MKRLLFINIVGFVSGVFESCPIAGNTLPPISSNRILNPAHNFLLFADELIYHQDDGMIFAQGNVQIEYDGNKIVASKVTYNQKTGRVIAQGNIEITQRDGNRIYAHQIDITHDLSEGFINFLRIETRQNTYFSADNSERKNKQITIFNNATYTACKPCDYEPNKNVLWKIKAKKIVWNNTAQTLLFENSRFEIFGLPIMRFPTFELPDPSVTRASGLLMPRFFYTSHLGIGIKNSYFWNLSNHYDLTFSTTLYKKQGLLTEGEWRQRLKTGAYNILFAHIHQSNPQNFHSGTIDSQNTHRYMLATKGDFRINPRWTYGWNIFAQSDQNFARTYKLRKYNNFVQLSQIYLNGLTNTNHFDARFYHFAIQNRIHQQAPNGSYPLQPWVLPRIDYTFTPNKSIYSGKLSFYGNIQSIYRGSTDPNSTYWKDNSLSIPSFPDIGRNTFRLTAELEWTKRFTAWHGLIFTPLLSLRSDATLVDSPEASPPNKTAENFSLIPLALRGVATAGLELRYPVLITSRTSKHILEPTAQIFIRNNEQSPERFPNEDSQNLTFDATTLFQRNKFSGYDRVEGGTRANIGLRYSGTFNKNWSFYALIGQSFHLAGKNSFAEKSFLNTSPNSGLETTRSDYVAMFRANHNTEFSIESRGQFNKKTGGIRRAEIEIAQKWTRLKTALQYSYIKNRSDRIHAHDSQEISFQTRIKFSDYWSVDNSVNYDLASDVFTKQGINLSYQDGCFKATLGYQKIRPSEKDKPEQNFNFSLSLRTVTHVNQKSHTND